MVNCTESEYPGNISILRSHLIQLDFSPKVAEGGGWKYHPSPNPVQPSRNIPGQIVEAVQRLGGECRAPRRGLTGGHLGGFVLMSVKLGPRMSGLDLGGAWNFVCCLQPKAHQ